MKNYAKILITIINLNIVPSIWKLKLLYCAEWDLMELCG